MKGKWQVLLDHDCCIQTEGTFKSESNQNREKSVTKVELIGKSTTQGRAYQHNERKTEEIIHQDFLGQVFKPSRLEWLKDAVIVGFTIAPYTGSDKDRQKDVCSASMIPGRQYLVSAIGRPPL
ncbi:MAG: hypothetical protein L6R35_000531 [Caloplaca aegaea]|nr:MAG: hypothetical protein L6R35_000531 [Caloplaca aegaea]